MRRMDQVVRRKDSVIRRILTRRRLVMKVPQVLMKRFSDERGET